MFLITTADERLWRTDDEVLFLGSWCRVWNRRHVWENIRGEVLPYHWDDRERLARDFAQIQSWYDQSLACIGEQLSELHGFREPRFWRILLGPWLIHFLEIAYDRYLSVRAVLDTGLVTDTLLPSPVVPPLSLELLAGAARVDSLNALLYGAFVRGLCPSKFPEVNLGDLRPSLAAHILRDRTLLKRVIEKASSLIPQSLNRNVIAGSYFPVLNLIKLEAALGQLPYLLTPELTEPEVSPISERRRKLTLGIPGEFGATAAPLFQQLFPVAYIENFSWWSEHVRRSFPRNPRTITTASLWEISEGFRFWSADHVSKGVPLLVAQHGGHFGTGTFCSSENHQKRIADVYCSWGWKSKTHRCVTPLDASKLTRNKIRRKEGRAVADQFLWIGNVIPRYSYRLFSAPVAGQYEGFILDQMKFFSTLSPRNRRRFVMRYYSYDFGWSLRERLEVKFPELVGKASMKSYSEDLDRSALTIHTTNTTTILESLAENIPTVAFWNPVYWELNSDATPYFDALREAGILFYSPEEAAAHIENISEGVDAWWQGTRLQDIRASFCDQYARVTPSWLHNWKQAILSASSPRKCTGSGDSVVPRGVVESS